MKRKYHQNYGLASKDIYPLLQRGLTGKAGKFNKNYTLFDAAIKRLIYLTALIEKDAYSTRNSKIIIANFIAGINLLRIEVIYDSI